MNSLRNRVQLIGRLGADPEVKHLNSNKTVANLRIATNETYRDANGEKVTDTQWHNVEAWSKLASFKKKYLKKGDEIAVEGRLVYRSFEDKNKVKRTVAQIIANEILMLESKNQSAQNKKSAEEASA